MILGVWCAEGFKEPYLCKGYCYNNRLSLVEMVVGAAFNCNF